MKKTTQIISGQRENGNSLCSYAFNKNKAAKRCFLATEALALNPGTSETGRCMTELVALGINLLIDSQFTLMHQAVPLERRIADIEIVRLRFSA